MLASVLDVGGWRQLWRTPRRCKRGSCPSKRRRLWHNYWASGRPQSRLWFWPAEQEMQYFFVAGRWGATSAWLRQMSRRIVWQYASFTGEAEVHAAEAALQEKTRLVPSKSHLKLSQAWILWRLARRPSFFCGVDVAFPLLLFEDLLFPRLRLSGLIRDGQTQA